MGELKLVLAVALLVIVLPSVSDAQLDTKDRPDLVILTNPIDYELSLDYALELPGFDIVYIDASSFKPFRTLENILILGGPDAPEGIGEIIQTILTEDEQSFLRKSKGTGGIFTRTNIWTEGQTITIIAGNNRYVTKHAELEFLEELSENIGLISEYEPLEGESQTFELSSEEAAAVETTIIESSIVNEIEPELETDPYEGTDAIVAESGVVTVYRELEIVEAIYPFTISLPRGEYMVTQKIDQSIYDLVGKKNYTYAYLRIGGIAGGARMNELSNYGVEALSLSPGEYYITKIDLNQLEKIASFPYVHWIGERKSEDKIGSTLKELVYSNESDTVLAERYKNSLQDRQSLDQIMVMINLYENDKNMVEDKNIVVAWSGGKPHKYGAIGDCGREIQLLGVSVNYRPAVKAWWYSAITNRTLIPKVAELECVFHIRISGYDSLN